MHRSAVLLRRFICLLVLVLGATVAAAQQPDVSSSPAPALIKFQGTIANTPSRTMDVTFALYSGQTGGVPLWLETQNVTVDDRGSYAVYIGAKHAGGIPIDLFNGGACYLGVEPEGQPEQDRILLSSALDSAGASAKPRGPQGKPVSSFPLLSAATAAGSEGLNRSAVFNPEQNSAPAAIPASTGGVSQATNESAADSGSGPAAPRVVTLPAATSVDTATVTLNGVVNPNGLATSYWFEYGTNEGMSKPSQTTHQALLAGSAEIGVSAKLTGLAAHATYYFRVVAQSTGGTSRGRILEFQSSGAGERSTTVTLTVANTGTGSGTVTATPVGRSCGTGCYTYTSGTAVTLTATANTGSSKFADWAGACSGTTASCNLTMSANQSVVATFMPSSAGTTLTIAATGNGSGTVTPSPTGTNCGTGCYAYTSGTAVTLTATPSTGSNFTGWTGNTACTGTSPCHLTMNSSQSVNASFALQTFNLTISYTGSGTGAVAPSPLGSSCVPSVSGCYKYNWGTVVSLGATRGASSVFGGWTGACSGTGACRVTMTSNQTVAASFTAGFSLTLSAAGNGTVTPSPAGVSCGFGCYMYSTGAVVTLTATPATGSLLAGWTGATCSGTTCAVTMSSNLTVTATFVTGDFNYKGSYPTPALITYTDISGQSLQVLAYPGQVQLYVNPTTSLATVTSLVQANGGTIIGRIQSFGYYLVSVAAGKESTFITAVKGNSYVTLAIPNSPAQKADVVDLSQVEGPNGELPTVPNLKAQVGNGVYLYVPDDYVNASINCGASSIAHGNATDYVASQNLSGTGQQMNIFAAAGNSAPPNDIASANAIALQDMTFNGTGRAVVNYSLQGAYVDAANNPLTAAQYRANERNLLWSFAAQLNALAVSSPSAFNQTVFIVSAGNGVADTGQNGLDLTSEMAQLHAAFPAVFPSGQGPRMIIVGGTQSNSTATDTGLNYSTVNGDIVYAPAHGVQVSASGCTADGTSFAAPDVSNIIASVLAANPNSSVGQVTNAFMQAYKNKGYVLPTVAEVNQILSPPTQYTLSLGTAGSGSGSVGASPPGLTYAPGTVVTVSAVPASNSSFVGWSGACSGSGSCVVTMNSNQSVTATFSLTPASGTYSGSCTAYGSSITCCSNGYCATVPAPAPTHGPFGPFSVPPGTSLSQFVAEGCASVTSALSSAGCTGVSCTTSSSSGSSLTLSLSCTVPGTTGCTNETVSETCTATLQ